MCTRPDTCANIQLIAPGADPTTPAEYKTLAKTTAHLKKTDTDGLIFQNLDINTVLIVMFTDACFANTTELRSQLGFVIVMADETGKCNI